MNKQIDWGALEPKIKVGNDRYKLEQQFLLSSEFIIGIHKTKANQSWTEQDEAIAEKIYEDIHYAFARVKKLTLGLFIPNVIIVPHSLEFTMRTLSVERYSKPLIDILAENFGLKLIGTVNNIGNNAILLCDRPHYPLFAEGYTPRSCRELIYQPSTLLKPDCVCLINGIS